MENKLKKFDRSSWTSERNKKWWKTPKGLELKKKMIERNKNDMALRAKCAEVQRNRIRTDEEKKKIGNATSERFKDPIFRKKHQEAASKASRENWKKPEYRKKVLKYWRPKNKDTKIERLVKEELLKRNIVFEQNISFPEFRTIPDFYIPSLKMVIYCDGSYWHSPLERQIADQRQVRELRDVSYTVFRLREQDILEDVVKCLDNIGLGQIKRLKILIGIPSASDYFHRKFVQSLMRLKYPPHPDIDINIVSGYQIPFARNRIVQRALETNSDYVFFVDADMVFPPNTLIKLLEHDVPMVNALAFRRTSPHYPCVFLWNEKESCYETMSYTSGFLECDATGMAAHLIKTEVFKKMKEANPDKPWYYYKNDMFSSDLTFCEEARKLGYKILIDTDVKIGHLGDENVITEEYYLNHLSPEAKEQWNKGMREHIKNNKADFKENSPSK